MAGIRNEHLLSGLLKLLRQEGDHLSAGGDVSLGNTVTPHINLKKGFTKISLSLLGRSRFHLA